MQKAYKIKPGTNVDLKDFDADEKDVDRDKAKERLGELKAELDDIQEELYAAGQHSVLIVFQGMDTSGKDGTIRKVFGDVNPAGCRVESFKVPTEEELSHDFLWRVHKVVPRKGMISIFNRSHYEDVLVVRVHNLVPEKVWKSRYETINTFERFLTDGNTIILKFFLHISKDEQEERLLDREKEIAKAWKLSVGDWQEREYWDDYTKAYEAVLSRTSTEEAPWYVVPANHKWYRNLLVAETVVDTLKPYRELWNKTLKAMSERRLAELHEFRSKLAEYAARRVAEEGVTG